IPAIVVLSQFLGRKTGSISGLVLGLVEDFLLTPFFGVRALSYYLIGYIVGELKVPKVKSSGFLVTAISSLGSFLLISLIYFILGKPGADILNYLPLALITEILLNSLVYLIYNIIVKKIMYIPTYKI